MLVIKERNLLLWKHHFDNKMVAWVKNANNKKRAAPEELQRLYQSSGKLYAEKSPVAPFNNDLIEKDLFVKFYKKRFKEDVEESDEDFKRLFNNLMLLNNNNLNLAGALLFSKNAQTLIPEFYITIIWFWGNEFLTNDYRSSENIYGNIYQQYKNTYNFILSTLHKIQNDKSFNSIGDSEIPEIVISELLINAIVHRDYFINDSIKVFVFENRIEIKSPGKLPNNLTVAEIKQGLQRRSRNIILTSYAIDMLPYRGTGSGILKSLQAYPNIEFVNNVESEFFKVIIYRPELKR